MGKVTGFMEYERIEEGYKPVPERLKHYKEFVIGLDESQAKVQAARCKLQRETAPNTFGAAGDQRPRTISRCKLCCLLHCFVSVGCCNQYSKVTSAP